MLNFFFYWYNLEDTQVNERRFLALVLLVIMAYSLATLEGQWLRTRRLHQYAGRLQEHQDKTLRHSDFNLGLYGQRWRCAMELWADLAFPLMALKPHKHLYFHQGLHVLALIQQAV